MHIESDLKYCFTQKPSKPSVFFSSMNKNFRCIFPTWSVFLTIIVSQEVPLVFNFFRFVYYHNLLQVRTETVFRSRKLMC